MNRPIIVFPSIWGICLLLICQISLAANSDCSLTHHRGDVKHAPSGCFEFYEFSQTWVPQFCHQQADDRPGCQSLNGSWAASNLGIHGLWPATTNQQDQLAYLSQCTHSPGCSEEKACHINFTTLNDKLLQTIARYAPIDSKQQMAYEWKKHGTCSGLTQAEYFSLMVATQEKATTPEVIRNNIGKAISYDQLSAGYGTHKAIFNCYYDKKSKRHFLVHVITFWNLDGSPREVEHTNKGTCPRKKPIYIATPPR